MTKNPVLQFMIWAFLLSNPVLAQESIQIEIDSAPVEVEISKPPTPAKQPEPTPPKQAEKVEEHDKTAEGGKSYGMAIGIGALVAGALAALAGGGGGSGGGSSTPSHP